MTHADIAQLGLIKQADEADAQAFLNKMRGIGQEVTNPKQEAAIMALAGGLGGGGLGALLGGGVGAIRGKEDHKLRAALLGALKGGGVGAGLGGAAGAGLGYGMGSGIGAGYDIGFNSGLESQEIAKSLGQSPKINLQY